MMQFKAKCECGNIICTNVPTDWILDGSVPVCCNKCGMIVLFRIDQEDVNIKTKDTTSHVLYEPKTNFKNGTLVIVDNEDHALHDWMGCVIDKDNLHYRVKFLNDQKIWIPYTWVIEYQEREDDV